MDQGDAAGGTRNVLSLAGRGEGVRWIALGLWMLLAGAAVGQLVTLHMLRIVDAGGHGVHGEPAFVLNQALGLVGSGVHVVGTIAVLIGVIVAGRQAGDRRARALLGGSAAGWIILLACKLFGLALTTEMGWLDPDSALLDVQRWSWLVHSGVWPFALVALVRALQITRDARPIDSWLVMTVALVSVGYAGLAIAAIVGAEIVIPIGRWGLLLDLALQAIVLGGVLVAVRRARSGHTQDGMIPPGAGGWERTASGLDTFAAGLVARALLALVGPLFLLLDALEFTYDKMGLAYGVTLLGCLGGSAAMAIGLNRVRSAPAPAAARVAGGAAALLMLYAAVVDAQFLLVMLRWLAGSRDAGDSGELYAVRAMAESMVALLAWLGLLRCLSSLGRGADAGALPGSRAVGVALVIVVLSSVMFDRRALVGDLPLGAAAWLPLVGAVATLMVALRFSGLARGAAARLRSGAPDELPLARAVARERDGAG